MDKRVDHLVSELLAQKGLPPVSADRNLWEAGLSSMDIVNLMLAVEETFGVELTEAQMVPDNFRTVRAIETLLGGLC